MTIEVNFDTDEFVSELTEDYTFRQWVDERIAEHVPDPDDVTIDTEALQAALNSGCFHIVESTFSGPGITEHFTDRDAEQTGEHIKSHLASLPMASESRCDLGRAFETAVLKVLLNVLRGERLTGDYSAESVQAEVESMLRRLLPGAITASDQAEQRLDVTEQFAPGDRVTCDEGAAIHGYVEGECVNPVRADVEYPTVMVENPPIQATIGEPVPAGQVVTGQDVPVVPEGMRRIHIGIDVNTVWSDDAGIIEQVYSQVRSFFTGDPNPVVTVEPASVAAEARTPVEVNLPDDVDREVAVFTMNGRRDGFGSVHVYELKPSGSDRYVVEKDGGRMTCRDVAHAFSVAMGSAAWNVHATAPRYDSFTPDPR